MYSFFDDPSKYRIERHFPNGEFLTKVRKTKDIKKAIHILNSF